MQCDCETIRRTPQIARPLFRLNPLAVFANQIHETFHGFSFGNVEFDRRLTHVEVDLARRTAHVAEVCIGHFARAVHDAAHDGDFYALEMLRAGFDAGSDDLEIEQCATTARAGYVIRLEAAAT